MNLLKRALPSVFGEDYSLSRFETNVLREFCRQFSATASRTPDLPELEEYSFQLLFCADLTQRGCSEYPLIEDSAFIAYAYTLKKFNYWQQRDGLPIPMAATSNLRLPRFPPPLKIRGELHAVEPSQFANLDKYKDNLVSFRRQRVKLLIPHRPFWKIPERYDNGKKIPLMPGQYHIGSERISRPVEAWMYIGVPSYWDEFLDAGYNNFKTVDHYEDKRPWLKEHYSLRREKFF